MEANLYQVLAMRTANRDTDAARYVLAALGISGEQGEIAAQIAPFILRDPLTQHTLLAAVALGKFVEAVKKHRFHGHPLNTNDLWQLHDEVGLHLAEATIATTVDKPGRPWIATVEIDREQLAKEAGDSLWYFALLAETNQTSLAEIMQTNIDKLRARYPEGFSHEASLNRTEYKGIPRPTDPAGDIDLSH